jgi:phage terminase small subunit
LSQLKQKSLPKRPYHRSEGVQVRRGKLNDKQLSFCREYLVDLNATQAAIRAKYSQKTAYSIGFDLLKKPEVQKEIARLRDKELAKSEATPERTIQEIARVALSSMKNYVSFGPGGVTIKDSSELTDDQLACVAEVSENITENGGTVKFKLHDKLRALDMLGKYHKLFSEKPDTAAARPLVVINQQYITPVIDIGDK